MTQATSPRSAYLAARLRSASPLQQRLILLDAAIAAAHATAEALRRDALEDAHVHAARCRGLVLQLACTLRGDAMPPLAAALNGLAVYIHGRVVRAVAERSPDAVEHAARLLASERDAWAARLRQTAASTPARGNAVA